MKQKEDEFHKMNLDYLKDKVNKLFKKKMLYFLNTLSEPLESNPLFNVYLPNSSDNNNKKNLSYVHNFKDYCDIYCLNLNDLKNKVTLLCK